MSVTFIFRALGPFFHGKQNFTALFPVDFVPSWSLYEKMEKLWNGLLYSFFFSIVLYPVSIYSKKVIIIRV